MILFLEPNPFASRLQILSALVQGASDLESVQICTPQRANGVDQDEFLRQLPEGVKVTTIPIRADRLGQKSVSPRIVIGILRRGRELLESGEQNTVVLTAVDDYPAIFWLAALYILFRYRHPRVFAVRYRVPDLLGTTRPLREKLRQHYFRWSVRLVNATVLMFDERVSVDTHTKWLPDPWNGPFGQRSRKSAREKLGWSIDDHIVTLVGSQNRRKGFDVAVPALMEVRSNVLPRLKVVIVGRVESDVAHELRRLSSAFGSDLSHDESFVADEQLADVLAGSSVVLLPYHIRFTSTSGVLVRAAASSTPVVASNHGLVGWRTSAHALGQTFPAGDSHAFALAIERALTSDHDPRAMSAYAASSSFATLVDAFTQAVKRQSH